MALISVASLNEYLDNLVQGYIRLLGSTTSPGNGMGDSGNTWGLRKELADARTVLTATADAEVITHLYSGLSRMLTDLTALKAYAPTFNSALGGISRHARAQGSTSYTNAASLLTWRNTGESTKWQCLQHPFLYDLWVAATGEAPPATVCAFPVVQGATYADALGKFVVSGAGTGTFTNGFAVDSSRYCGGTGRLNVSSLSGTGNVTVTGVGFNPATGAVTGSVTWITNVTANGNTTMTVGAGTAPADCLIVDVTNISIAAGITAGTIYVEAAPPSRGTWPS